MKMKDLVNRLVEGSYYPWQKDSDPSVPRLDAIIEDTKNWWWSWDNNLSKIIVKMEQGSFDKEAEQLEKIRDKHSAALRALYSDLKDWSKTIKKTPAGK